MTAYALAHLRPRPPLHDDVFAYIERIQGTMAPFGGRFLVHGTDPEVLEGPFEGTTVLLDGVPDDYDAARTAAAMRAG